MKLKLSISEREEIAGKLNPYRGSTEPVRVHIIMKPNGDFRTVCDFGIENRSLQYLVRAPLIARTTLAQNQYATRGVPQAIKQACKLMLENKYVITADVTKAYSSLNCGDLPLPRSVIEKTVIGLHLHVHLSRKKSGVISDFYKTYHGELQSTEKQSVLGGAHGNAYSDPTNQETKLGQMGKKGWEDSLPEIPPYDSDSVSISHPLTCEQAASIFFEDALTAARSGVPQGSALSPAVFEYAFSRVLKDHPAVVSYADDLLVVGNSSEEVWTRFKDLEGGLNSLLIGSQPVAKSPRGISRKADFLGYELTSMGGTVRVRLPEAKWLGFVKEFHKRRYQAMKCLPIERGLRLKLLRQYLTKFFSACPMLTEAEQEKAKLAQLIAQN